MGDLPRSQSPVFPDQADDKVAGDPYTLSHLTGDDEFPGDLLHGVQVAVEQQQSSSTPTYNRFYATPT